MSGASRAVVYPALPSRRAPSRVRVGSTAQHTDAGASRCPDHGANRGPDFEPCGAGRDSRRAGPRASTFANGRGHGDAAAGSGRADGIAVTRRVGVAGLVTVAGGARWSVDDRRPFGGDRHDCYPKSAAVAAVGEFALAVAGWVSGAAAAAHPAAWAAS